jgi:hypothetical protein
VNPRPTSEVVVVVGHNGAATTECSFSYPVVRRVGETGDSVGGLLTGDPLEVHWDPWHMVLEQAEIGALTLFQEADWFPLPDGKSRSVVVWVKPGILEPVLGPEWFDLVSEDTRWHRLDASKTWVGVFDEDRDLPALLNPWAERLIGVFEESLGVVPLDWKQAARLADLGLLVAHRSDLRYLLYVRWCAAIFHDPAERPERVLRAFNTLVKDSFQDDWENFQERMRAVVQAGIARGEVGGGGPAKTRAGVVVRPWPAGPRPNRDRVAAARRKHPQANSPSGGIFRMSTIPGGDS